MAKIVAYSVSLIVGCGMGFLMVGSGGYLMAHNGMIVEGIVLNAVGFSLPAVLLLLCYKMFKEAEIKRSRSEG